MAGLIPQDFIDDLVARADIVEVIGRRVQLKKAGREFKACCPFHEEKTPSFTVSPNDVISVRHKAQAQARIQGSLDLAEQYGFPGWVEVDTKKKEGVFKAIPDRSDLPPDISEQLVVELYSK